MTEKEMNKWANIKETFQAINCVKEGDKNSTASPKEEAILATLKDYFSDESVFWKNSKLSGQLVFFLNKYFDKIL